MFGELVTKFAEFIEREKRCVANLYVNGLATQVTVTYLPEKAMEIKGLPSDLPSYLLFKGEQVYLDREKTKVPENEEAAFYQLYRTWDPRVIAQADPSKIEQVGGRWKASYHLDKAIRLDPSVAERLRKYIKRPQEIEFVAEGSRLLELSEWDFSDQLTKFTLVFAWPEDMQQASSLPRG